MFEGALEIDFKHFEKFVFRDAEIWTPPRFSSHCVMSRLDARELPNGLKARRDQMAPSLYGVGTDAKGLVCGGWRGWKTCLHLRMPPSKRSINSPLGDIREGCPFAPNVSPAAYGLNAEWATPALLHPPVQFCPGRRPSCLRLKAWWSSCDVIRPRLQSLSFWGASGLATRSPFDLLCSATDKELGFHCPL